MSAKLRKVDRAVIDALENVCHGIQRQFGVTNYWIIRITTISLALIAATDIFLALSGNNKPPVGEQYFTIAYVILCLHYAFFVVGRREQEAFDRLSRGLANMQKIHPLFFVFRWIFIFGLALNLVLGTELIKLSFYIILIIDGFLEACDPLPPCRGKFFERIDVAMRSSETGTA